MTRPKFRPCPYCQTPNQASRNTCHVCFGSLYIKQRIKDRVVSLDSRWGQSVVNSRNAARIVDSARIAVCKLEAVGYKPILFIGKQNKKASNKWVADIITHLQPTPVTRSCLEKMQRAYEFILTKGTSMGKQLDKDILVAEQHNSRSQEQCNGSILDLESLTVEQLESLTVEQPESLSIKQESLTVERPESLTVERPESLTVERPESLSIKQESLTVERPESLTVERPKSLSIKLESLTMEQLESLTVEQPNRPTLKWLESLSIKQESLTVEQPESLTVEQPERLTVERPENLIVEQPESLTIKQESLDVEQPENLTIKQKSLNVERLESLCVKHESPTWERPERLIVKQESLTVERLENLTIKQESLNVDQPESPTIEQLESLPKKSETVFILNLVPLSSPCSPTSLSPTSSTTFTAFLPPHSSPPPMPRSKSLRQRKKRSKPSICSPAHSATSVSPPSLITTDISIPQSCPPPAASSISQSLSQEGPYVKKRRKGCRKCSRQKIFLFDKITGERIHKGKAELKVHWLPCTMCGRTWDDTWEPASEF